MSLFTLLIVIAAFGLPALFIWGMEKKRPELLKSWHRWLLYLAGGLSLLLLYGFEGGRWMGIGHLFDALWPEALLALLGAALLLGSGGRTPSEGYYPERTGRKAPT